MPNWTTQTRPLPGAQFITVGPFETTSGEVDFFPTLDEATPITLTEDPAHYVVLTDTPLEHGT